MNNETFGDNSPLLKQKTEDYLTVLTQMWAAVKLVHAAGALAVLALAC
jgi:hypothetical protein